MEVCQVSEEEFMRYEKVRESGITNMWAINLVSAYSRLTRGTVEFIMEHYTELADKYLG